MEASSPRNLTANRPDRGKGPSLTDPMPARNPTGSKEQHIHVGNVILLLLLTITITRNTAVVICIIIISSSSSSSIISGYLLYFQSFHKISCERRKTA